MSMLGTNERTKAPARVATLRTLIEAYAALSRADADIRPATLRARLGAVKRLLKTWPALATLQPVQITSSAVFEWASQFKREGTRFRPPGATLVRTGNSATSVNSAIDALRGILDLAVERGQIRTNPVRMRHPSGRLKKRIARKGVVLPTREQADALFDAMENNGSVGGRGAEAADFCRFLMMSGERIGEVPLTTWGCVLWDRRLMRIPGFKSGASYRMIPLFSELTLLLERIRARRISASRFHPKKQAFLEPGEPILRIRECQKTIDSACLRTGIARITHHDFRHLFATACIESGVDVPTVSRWLGHRDGGVLAMNVYGHLRMDHSLAEARKVRFADAAPA